MHGSQRQVAAGDDVIEGDGALQRVAHRCLGDHRQPGAGAERGVGSRARNHQPGTQRGAGAVATADDHGCAAIEAGGPGCLRGQATSHGGRGHQLRQQRRIQLGRSQQLGRPATGALVIGVGAGRVGGIGAATSGGLQGDEVLGDEDAVCAREDLRLVRTHPHGLGQRVGGIEPVTHDLESPVVTDPLGEEVALGAGARVSPDDGRSQRPVGVIDEDQALHLTREHHAGDLAALRPTLGQQRPRRSAEGRPPVCGSCSALPPTPKSAG